MTRLSSTIWILLALLSGFVLALLGNHFSFPSLSFTANYIEPVGKLFLNSLKIVAMPLVATSLISGVSSIGDFSKLSRIGGKTVTIYMCTTVVAVAVGLVIGNLIEPGGNFPESVRAMFLSEVQQSLPDVHASSGMPKSCVDRFISDNIFAALTDNANMLQIVVLSTLFSVLLLRMPSRKAKLIIMLAEGVKDVLIEFVRLIMRFLAPIGVFAMTFASLMRLGNEIWGYLSCLMWYIFAVVGGLALMVLVVYPSVVWALTGISWYRFLRCLYPAQLEAFTTSSSTAALPITMERVEGHLGVSKEISSFVLPVGATINVDGTALYQGIAILFITQVFGQHLSIWQQITVVGSVTAASVGIGGVPGGSIITIMAILDTLGLGLSAESIALIYPVDRILDMFRTAANITGDASVAVYMAHSEGDLAEEIDETTLQEDIY